jgi:Skp family chaperone for outer membrane proteins
MEKASRRFTGAVRKAARAGRYDLVAKLGSVENVADVPDITQDVIDRL